MEGTSDDIYIHVCICQPDTRAKDPTWSKQTTSTKYQNEMSSALRDLTKEQGLAKQCPLGAPTLSYQWASQLSVAGRHEMAQLQIICPQRLVSLTCEALQSTYIDHALQTECDS
jgi:hypothetical protein